MKLILKNLFSLGFVQGINLIIPLLLTPFLIKTIGVSLFGVMSTAQAVAYFFVILTDFGFNITSVRRLAQAKNDPQEIQSIVNGVFFCRLVLLIISFVVFVTLILIIPQFNKYFFVYLGSFSIVIGQAILPIWFFQGMENIKKTILPVLIFKLMSFGLIFVFIKTTKDAQYVNLILGLGNIFTGVSLYAFINSHFRISIKLVTFQQLIREFKDSVAIFVSNIGVVIYGNTSLIILSFFLTPAILAIYSVVDKIVQLLRAILAIVHQVSYPRICYLIKDRKSLVLFIKNFYGIVWLGILLLCFFIFSESALFASYFVKEKQSHLITSNILKQMSFIVFITSLNMPFFQTLLAYKKDWLTVRILLGGSILSIVLNLVLVPVLNIEGTIITIYFIETMVTCLLIYFTLQLIKNEKRELST